MRRLLLAGIAGATIAALIFVVVVSVTDVRVTTATNQATSTTTTASGSRVRGTPPPPCGRRRGLSFNFPEPQGAAGALMIPVSISLAGGTPCVIDARARFKLRTPVRNPGIKGNPRSWQLTGILRNDSGPSSIFAWRNWCGPEGRFDFKLAVRGHGSASLRNNEGTPPCEAPGSGTPSSLTRFAVPG